MTKRLWAQIAFCGICYILMFLGCDAYNPSADQEQASSGQLSTISLDATAQKLSDWTLLQRQDEHAWLDSAVGRLEAGISCTASIVYKEPFDKNQKALALTAGHCIDSLLTENWNGERILENFPLKAEISFHWLKSHQASDRVFISTKSVLYGSMQPYDIALLELTKTYRELSEMGLKFIALHDGLPPMGLSINPSIPIMGTENALRMHISTCEILEPVHVKEHLWNWPDSYAHSCKAEKGSSGSPIIVKEQNGAYSVGTIVNTKRNKLEEKDQDLECSMDHPCEINVNSGLPCNKEVAEETYRNYGQPVAPLMECFNESSFDLSVESCELRRADKVAPEISNLDFREEEGNLIISIETGDDKDKGPASMAEVQIHYDAFPKALPIYFPINQPGGLKYNNQTGLHELSIPVKSMAFGFGLSEDNSSGKLKVIIMDESLNKSKESDWIPFGGSDTAL